VSQHFRASAISTHVDEVSDEQLEAIVESTGGTVRHEAHDSVLHVKWRFTAGNTAEAAVKAAGVVEEALYPLGYEVVRVSVYRVRSPEEARELLEPGERL
jgi:regulator of protease activity HflC (stomatin/prohibitin superfamily)